MGTQPQAKIPLKMAVQEKLIRLQFAEQIDINKGKDIQPVSQEIAVQMGGTNAVFIPKK